MIRVGVLVEISAAPFKTPGLVIKDPYLTVVSTKSPITNKTIYSSEVLVVDVLVSGTVYKKVPVNTLNVVR